MNNYCKFVVNIVRFIYQIEIVSLQCKIKAMKINYVALVIFLAIIGGIIFTVYDVRHRGPNEFGELWLTASNKLIIVYIFTVIIGYSGISLFSTYTGKLRQDRKNRSSFQVTEAVYSHSIVSRNSDTSTELIYEYYVNGKRYECKNDTYFVPSKRAPKISIRYNPENPEEVMMSKENTLGITAGILCIGLAILLIYASTKIECEGGRSVYGHLKNMIQTCISVLLLFLFVN